MSRDQTSHVTGGVRYLELAATICANVPCSTMLKREMPVKSLDLSIPATIFRR